MFATLFVFLLTSSNAVANVLGCYIPQSRADSIRSESTNCTGPCRGALKNAIINLSVDPSFSSFNTSSGAGDENGQVVLVWLAKYVATGDTTALNKAFTFVDGAWNSFNFKSSGETNFDAAYPNMLIAAALTLDLGFDGLSASQRTALLNDIHSASLQLWNAINSANPPYWKDTVLQNHNWSSWGSLGVGACALAKYPSTPFATDASTWLNAVGANFTTVNSRVQSIIDGTWHEGQAYGSSVHTLTVIYTVLQNTGIADLISDSPGSPSYFKAYVNFLLGSYMPEAAREGPDYHGDFFGFSQEPPVISRWAAWQYGASAPQFAASAQWLANSWRSGAGHWAGSTTLVSGYNTYAPDDGPLVFELLNWDTGTVPSSSTPPAATGDLYLGDAQMFTMRAAPDNSTNNTMLLSLKSGNLGGDAEWHHICDNNGQNKGTAELNYGHDHSDDNGLYLTFGKDQLVPEGTGYFIGHVGLGGEPANLTVYHNSLLVDGHGQFGGGHWSYDQTDSISAGVHGEDDTTTWYCNRYGHLQYHTGTTSFGYAMGDGKSLYYKTQAQLFSTPPDYSSPLQRFDRHVFMSRAHGGRYGIVRDVIESTSSHSYEVDWHFEASQSFSGGWLHGTSQTGGEVGIFVAAPSAASVITTNTQSPDHTAEFDGLASYQLSQVRSSGANVTFLELISPIGAVGGVWANRPAVSVPAGDLVAGGSLLVIGTFNGGATETEQWIFNRLPTDTRSSGTTPHSLTLSGIAGVIATNTGGAVIRAGLFEGTDVQYDGSDELNFNTSVDSAEARWNGATVAVEWNSASAPTTVQVRANGTTQATFNGQAGTCIGAFCSWSPGGLTISNVQSTPTSTSATITWTTNLAADSTVNYGTTSAYGTTQHDATQTTQHSITLTGLNSNTTYHYQVQSANSGGTASSADLTFATSPIGTFQLTLVTPLALSPGSPATNQPVTATFTVKNTGTVSGTVPYFITKALDPSNGNVDFAQSASQTLAPGATYPYTASRSFATAGSYTAWPAYFDGTNLVELAPAHSAFTVQAALFADNFDRTTGLGTNWAVQHGSFTTDGNFAVAGTMTGSGTGNWAAVVPALNTNNYSVSADLTVPSGSLFSGVVARSSDSLNFDRSLYAAQLSTDGSVHLYRRNDWTWTQLASTAAGIVANTSYNVRLIVSGASPVHLEAWVNGVQKIVFDDSSASQITTGVPGIENYDTNVKYDNFTVTVAPLFVDDFNRTTGLGAAWAVQHGSFTTDGNFAVAGTMTGSGTGNWAGLNTSLGTSNYSVIADLIVPSGSLFSGLVARSSDPANFDRNLYSAQIATDGSVYLYRRNDWNWTELAATASGVVANTSYNLKLVVSGSSPVHLEVWLNGLQKIIFDDSSASQITTGIPGMENYDTNVKYDNFTVTAP